MEAKKTPRTPRPGEKKSMNPELFKEMANVWNNSRMTSENCLILTNKLDDVEIRKLIEWFRYANRNISGKLARSNSRIGRGRMF